MASPTGSEVVKWFLALTVLQVAPLFAQPETAAYGEFALKHNGDAAAGIRMFNRAACSQCHSVDGSGNKAGPDLSAVGDKFQKAGLIQAVLSPSSSIAVGYDATFLTLKDGSTAAGVIKQATDAWIELMGIDAQPARIATDQIAKRETSPVSLMPENLQAAGTPTDFADLIAYLGSLHQNTAGIEREEIPKAGKPVRLDSFFDEGIHLIEPLWFGEVPERENHYVVLEHRGMAWLINRTPAGDVQRPLLDLTGVVRVGGATGLLSMAFHPKFPADPRYFLKYQIVEQGKISTLIVERRFSADMEGDSGEESRQLLKIPSTTQDHNGGCVAFGPDGYLYFGMGDTGPQRDPQGHSQDMNLLLGKILRIDVDHRDPGLPYAIPADNPFVNSPGVRPEIWASGFREPWRFSWDSVTGDFWVGDVGQDQFEEVGIVRAGENHGWNVFEGFNPYSERYRRDGETFVQPVWSYSHRLGSSVTGGFVYRGTKAPLMRGWYIFADHESRRIWALTQTDRKLNRIIEIGQAPTRAVSISQTRNGELYLVGFNSGKIHHLALDTVDPVPAEIRMLAATSEKSPVSGRITTTRPSANWMSVDFDDATWTLAPGGYGSSGTPGGVIRTEWRTSDLWLRREFILPDSPTSHDSLTLRIHHDEDAEIYLNGGRVADLPRWTQGYIDFALPAEAAKALRPGRNVLAIHCHQNSGGQYLDAGLFETVEKP